MKHFFCKIIFVTLAIFGGLSLQGFSSPVFALDPAQSTKPFQSTLDTLNATAKDGGYAVDTSTNEQVLLGSLLGRMVQILLSLVGVVFAILMIYGGITWMTAGGDESKVTSAKNIIRNSIIGIIVIFSAFLITRFIDDVLRISTGAKEPEAKGFDADVKKSLDGLEKNLTNPPPAK